MAVYTEVPDDDLTNFVARYDIGEVTSCKGIAEGVENTNYLLRTSAGSFILTLYERRVAREDLPFFLGLMEHLARKGISCPTPMRTRDGTMEGELMGRPAAIITFLDGVWLRRPQARHCGALGESLARLHLAVADFQMTRANALSVDGWRTLASRLGTDADEVMPGLASLIEQECQDLSSSWPSDLPKGVIHADLFPNNVFFLGNRLSGLIDFYFACNDLLAYDVAICLNAWCFEDDGSLNVTKARSLLAAYQSVRPLEMSEMDALPLLGRGAALRFLLTRAYDWLHTPQSAMVNRLDPLEYLRKLRFFGSIKSASGLGADFTP
jgi:homoserine kinase type II